MIRGLSGYAVRMRILNTVALLGALSGVLPAQSTSDFQIAPPKLVEPGAKPLRMLRFTTPAKTPTQQRWMEFDVKIEVLADGKTVRTKELPHYALLFASGLAQAATKGQTYTLTLKDGRMYQNSAIKAEDLPAAQERIRASAGSLVKFTVSETGTLSGSELVASPNAVPGIANGMHDLLRQLRIMGVPLPAEPVGVGAKWVVRVEKFQAAGSQVPLSYDLNYHLKGIEENKVQIEAIAELSLPPEAMPLPFEPKMVKEAKPPHFRMKLDMEQNLEMPLPERMELSFEVGNSAKVEAEGAVHDFATRSLGFMRWVPDVPKQ